MNVAVVGASNKPERYAYQAVMLLRENGHTPYPVHPGLKAIEGIQCYATLRAIPAPVHTVSVYLSAQNQAAIAEDIMHSGARRVIFNPGAENDALQERLRNLGVEAVKACTLLLLRVGEF